jgi:hypothetical protein
MKFESMLQAEVPKGRDGKHKRIVELLLNDISQLEEGAALKVPLADLPDTKENIRSALSRATKQRGIEIVTSSDDEFLYIWKPEEK